MFGQRHGVSAYAARDVEDEPSPIHSESFEDGFEPPCLILGLLQPLQQLRDEQQRVLYEGLLCPVPLRHLNHVTV